MAADFTESAKGLARNPLGIIALFISFVYALACLVIGVSTSTLTSPERMPLILFVALFPVLTLGCFMWLVIQHPTKLYAPSDYKEDKSFMETMGVSESFKKLVSPQAHPEEAVNPIANIMNSSITGIFFLYAAYLAKEHKKSFTLEALHTQCDLLAPQYTHGFLVAAASVGAITLGSITEPFTVEEVNEIVNAEIYARVHYVANNSENREHLRAQLQNLEDAFTMVSNEESEAS